jgi:uncharacterized protein YjcR
MYIPSNYTLSEVLANIELFIEVKERIEQFIPDIEEKNEEIKSLERDVECLKEQLYFAIELLQQIFDKCDNDFRFKETKNLVVAIQNYAENSYFEL